MASIPSSPSSISFESAAQASPLAQQQDGDDGDVVVARAIDKLHFPSAALGPEDDNQDDEDKEAVKEGAGIGSVAPSEQDAGVGYGPEPQRQHPDVSLDKLEIDHLKQEHHALAKQMNDKSAQYACQMHTLHVQLQQQTAAHDRKEQEWKQQEKQLHEARNDAVDDTRRAQAQVHVLQQRLRELEELLPSSNNNGDVGESQPQQGPASLEPTLHLTQRQNYHPHQQQQPSGSSGDSSYPHAVQRSVVGSTTRTSESHVMCHPQNPRSDFSSSVRVTRIGRNRSAPSGGASVDSLQAPPTTGSSSMMMPPPTLNLLQWREDLNNYESQCSSSTTTGHRCYSSPPQQRSSTLPAQISVRPSTFYPTQSYNNTSSHYQHQRQSPVGYPQPSQQFAAPPPAALAPEPTTLISIYPVPDEATTPTSSEPHGFGSRLEKKASSVGLLAYCSELLASSLAPATSALGSASASVAPSSSAVGATTNNTSSPNARVAPAWQLFSNSSSNNSNAQTTKQTSLDVEQGFSPPRPHQISHEMQHQQQHQQGHFATSSYSNYSDNNASAPQLQSAYQGSPSPASSSSPPQYGRASSVLPTHSFSPF